MIIPALDTISTGPSSHVESTVGDAKSLWVQKISVPQPQPPHRLYIRKNYGKKQVQRHHKPFALQKWKTLNSTTTKWNPNEVEIQMQDKQTHLLGPFGPRRRRPFGLLRPVSRRAPTVQIHWKNLRVLVFCTTWNWTERAKQVKTKNYSVYNSYHCSEVIGEYDRTERGTVGVSSLSLSLDCTSLVTWSFGFSLYIYLRFFKAFAFVSRSKISSLSKTGAPDFLFVI